MPQVLQSDLPLPPAAALLRLPAARAFGASADAAHHPLGPLARLLSARPLSGFCPACCTSASGETPIALVALVAPVAPASPIALRLTAADELLGLDFSCLLKPRAQSSDVVLHVPHCTLL